MQYNLLVNGFAATITVSSAEINNVHLPLLSWLAKLQQQKQRRLICLYAAPPGTGKSTNTLLWEAMAGEQCNLPTLQALSIDGFHYCNEYLQSHTGWQNGEQVSLMSIKGSPETYNIALLEDRVQRLSRGEQIKWPYYDRNIHDPVVDAISVTAAIVVIEGNWVLLNEGRWPQLRSVADFSIYHDAEEKLLCERLIERKVRGGASRAAALAHYQRTDSPNIRRVRENLLPANAYINWSNDLNSWVLKI